MWRDLKTNSFIYRKLLSLGHLAIRDKMLAPQCWSPMVSVIEEFHCTWMPTEKLLWKFGKTKHQIGYLISTTATYTWQSGIRASWSSVFVTVSSVVLFYATCKGLNCGIFLIIHLVYMTKDGGQLFCYTQNVGQNQPWWNICTVSGALSTWARMYIYFWTEEAYTHSYTHASFQLNNHQIMMLLYL